MSVNRRRAAERFHRVLLRSYPAAFRREFGAEMKGAFAEALDAARRRGSIAASWLLIRTVGQMMWLGVQERRDGANRVRSGDRPSRRDRVRQLVFDGRLGVRQILRSPRSAAMAGVLAIGFAATAVASAVLNGTVVRGRPFERAHELMHFERQRGVDSSLAVTPHDYLDWR